METKLTVCFEEPFWVGIFERTDGNRYSVCKVTFGAEPTDAQLYTFLLKYYGSLQFSKAEKIRRKMRADNPKRRQRETKKLLAGKTGVGTKAQQALKKQYEESKTLQKRHKKEQKDAEKERQFAIKQQKKKAKHKGH